MTAEKTDAIVLRVVEFSESSSVVTLMTRDFGKITALAKGARRIKSPFEAALDVLAICRIVFLKRSSGSMELLTEAKLERRFRGASWGLETLYAAYYVVELLRLLTDDGDPHNEAYEVAEQTIRNLDEGKNVAETLVPFELRLLKSLGHQPVFTMCAGCGKERTAKGRVSFGLDAGGVLCRSCRTGQRNIVSLSSEGWHFLNELTMAIADERELETTEWPRGEVRKLLNNYITHLLGYPPRMHSYLVAKPGK